MAPGRRFHQVEVSFWPAPDVTLGLGHFRAVTGTAYLILSTDTWVGALIRRAELGGAFATVARKGDPRGGTVLVKVLGRRAGTVRLYAEAVRADGERVWMHPTRIDNEAEADAYIVRAVRVDPDLWVVEIEDAQGRHFLTEAVDEG